MAHVVDPRMVLPQPGHYLVFAPVIPGPSGSCRSLSKLDCNNACWLGLRLPSSGRPSPASFSFQLFLPVFIFPHSTYLSLTKLLSASMTRTDHSKLEPDNLLNESKYSRMLPEAHIQGSKSNVAMDAWLPQVSYAHGKWLVVLS